MSAPTIDRSTCSADRHGTIYALRHRGCRCPDSREARRLYDKRLRTGNPEQRLVPAIGVRRRIQALWAVGHNSVTIGAHANMHPHEVQQIAQHRDWVLPHTAADIRRSYLALKNMPGTSSTTARRAAAAGYPPPSYWDAGDDIDLPEPEPEPDYVDEIAVERVWAAVRDLAGSTKEEQTARAVASRPAFEQLTKAEQAAVCKLAHAAGWTPYRISLTWSLNIAKARRLAGGDQ